MALAARVGVTAAAKQLGVHESQLYGWRSKEQREQSQGEAERQLAAENARLKRQLAEQAEELAILRSGGVLREEPEVRYAFMDQHSGMFRITTMCRVLRVSRSGFYVWRHRQAQPTPRQQRQALRAKAAKKFKATTNSKHDLPLAPNLLKQDFTATTINQKKWVGDISVPQQAA